MEVERARGVADPARVDLRSWAEGGSRKAALEKTVRPEDVVKPGRVIDNEET